MRNVLPVFLSVLTVFLSAELSDWLQPEFCCSIENQLIFACLSYNWPPPWGASLDPVFWTASGFLSRQPSLAGKGGFDFPFLWLSLLFLFLSYCTGQGFQRNVSVRKHHCLVFIAPTILHHVWFLYVGLPLNCIPYKLRYSLWIVPR